MRNHTIKGLIALAACAASLLAAGQAQFVSAPEASVQVSGTSSLHEWKMQGATIRGTITLDELVSRDLTPQTWKSATPALVSVTIPVSSIRSEHARMDKLMQQALKAEKNPDITYQLTGASLESLTADGFVIQASGKLTIAGTTRDIEMKVHGRELPGRNYVLSSEVPIRMKDYGIKPPTAMMGTIKTGDEVKVSFRWSVTGSN